MTTDGPGGTAWPRALAVAALAPLAIVVALWLRAQALAIGAPVPEDLMGLSLAPPMLAFVAMGTILAGRRPRNPVGWLLVTMALLELFGSGVLGWGSVRAAAVGHPAAGVLRDLSSAVSMAGPGWMAIVLLVFPSGHLPQARPYRVLLAVLLTWMVALIAVGVGLPDASPVRNAIGVLVQPLVIPAGYVALVARYRGATGVERRQLTWVVTATTLLVTFHAAYFIASATAGFGSPPARAGLAGVGLSMLLLAVAIVIGILRHGLFDLERLLNRTAVYSLVTAVLVGVYAVVAVLPALLFDLPSESDLLVAAGTLAAAATVGPVRRRAQDLIDRRFDRERYDAARTVGAFGARLRDELDIGTVCAELTSVATATTAPSSSTVWLRSS